jgi:hypothetical protein
MAKLQRKTLHLPIILQSAASDKPVHRNNVVHAHTLIGESAGRQTDGDAVPDATGLPSQSFIMKGKRCCAPAPTYRRATICVALCIRTKCQGGIPKVRICKLYPVHAASSPEFKWEWRSDDCGRRSGRKFDFFYDCMADARSHGFKPILPQPTGDSAPAHYAVTYCAESI